MPEKNAMAKTRAPRQPIYEDQEKDRLEDWLSPDRVAESLRMLGGVRFVVLNVSLWRCGVDWNVPERRISDNLLLFSMDGSLRVTVAKRTQTLRPGDYAVIPENAPHAYRLAPGCARSSNFVMHVLPLYDLFDNPFRRFDSPFQTAAFPDSVYRRLRTSVALKNSDRDVALSYAAGLLKDLFLESIKNGRYRPPEFPDARDRLSRAFEFIAARYREDFGVEDLAASVNLKCARFRRVFREASGLSPIEYIHRFRLQQAARLLARFDWGLGKIAAESGFRSTTYFCSSFMKSYRMTPEQFRRAYR